MSITIDIGTTEVTVDIIQSTISLEVSSSISGPTGPAGATGGTPYSTTFENSDLVANVLTEAHGLARLPAAIMIYDASGNKVTAMTSATTTNVVIDFGGTITGTWNLVVI